MAIAEVEEKVEEELFDVETGSKAGVRGGKYAGRRSGAMKRSYIVTIFANFSGGILCAVAL